MKKDRATAARAAISATSPATSRGNLKWQNTAGNGLKASQTPLAATYSTESRGVTTSSGVGVTAGVPPMFWGIGVAIFLGETLLGGVHAFGTVR